jgi:hypothetical protein
VRAVPNNLGNAPTVSLAKHASTPYSLVKSSTVLPQRQRRWLLAGAAVAIFTALVLGYFGIIRASVPASVAASAPSPPPSKPLALGPEMAEPAGARPRLAMPSTAVPSASAAVLPSAQPALKPAATPKVAPKDPAPPAPAPNAAAPPSSDLLAPY